MNRLFSYEIPDLEVCCEGPPLESGPLPLLLYFSLSAEESLTLDPFNQPLKPLLGLPLRIFSATLPGHEKGSDHRDAMALWANNPSLLLPFFASIHKLLNKLVEEGIAEKGKIALMGLSRGAFAALHIAAESPLVHAVCAFAPLTTFETLAEFQETLTPPSLNLSLKASALAQKKLIFFLSNRDTRIGTDQCIKLAREIVEESFAQGHRSPAVELYYFHPSAIRAMEPRQPFFMRELHGYATP